MVCLVNNFLLLPLIFGASVSNVLCMLSFIVGFIPEIKGGPPVSEKKKVETAMVFLDWLKKVCPGDS